MAAAAKTLIISEKPSVGRDIAAAIPGQTFKRSADGSHLESEKVIITWAVGHLLRLANPEEYKPEWKKWRREDLPLWPDEFKLKPIDSSKKQLQAVRTLLKRTDIKEVINACDAGREGELIFRYIMQAAKCSMPVRRLWLASMTEESIRDGLANLKPGDDYDGLADAARCRSEADWIVGMNGSRAATLTLRPALGGACSIGRVQTPTLAILVNRELQIRNFKPEDYWIVEATFATDADGHARRYPGVYQDGKRIQTEAEAQQIAEQVRGQGGKITKLEQKQVKEKAPALYDLTSLQREASNHFGWTAKKTLEVAQRLYEQHKLLTYPRTDSRWLTEDIGKCLPELLTNLAKMSVYAPHTTRLLASDLPFKQVVNNAKVTDHHAIIPTGKVPSPDLSKEDKQLYDMVTRRLLAALSPASVAQRTRVETTVREHLFVTKGRIIVVAGWRAVYEGVKWFKTEEQALPELKENEAVTTLQSEFVAKQTQPPKRLSDAGLLGAMETAGKLVDDDETREAMKESGLGTPATRASIIERLIGAKYVAREGKALVPTEKGVKLIQLLGEHPLTSPSLTGEWERRMGLISRAEDSRASFMTDLRAFTQGMVGELALLADNPAVIQATREAADATEGEEADNILAPCPNCGRPLRESPKSWSCWSPAHPGCGMAIWKTMSQRRIPKKAALELATQHRTSEKITGFKSKAGKPFDAHLKLARKPDGTPKVTFDFDR